MDTAKVVGAQLAALRSFDSVAFRKRVNAALRAHDTVRDAGETLQVPVRTLYRWIAEDPTLTKGARLIGRGQWTEGRSEAMRRAAVTREKNRAAQ